MTLEMESLVAKKVFEVCTLPKGKQAIGCWRAYWTKRNVDGTIEKHKARLVANGYLKRKGLEYHKTYAPSTLQETFCLVLSHMAREAWYSQKMDFMTAFLNSVLQEEVYLKQPKGFVDPNHADWVWWIKASLYGLKQSAREWNVLLTKELVSYSLNQSKANPVLFTYQKEGKVICSVVVHVDYIIITGQTSFLNNISFKFQARFKMLKVGPVDTYLSLKVERGSNNEVYLSQQHYIQHIVNSHLPLGSKPAFVPCNSLFSNLKSFDDSALTSEPYSELIGMLQWATNGTRPNIQFSVNQISQFLQKPNMSYWQAAIHILCYLNTYKSLWLCLGLVKKEPLQGYSNANWASTSEDRQSTTGWIFKYARGPIS